MDAIFLAKHFLVKLSAWLSSNPATFLEIAIQLCYRTGFLSDTSGGCPHTSWSTNQDIRPVNSDPAQRTFSSPLREHRDFSMAGEPYQHAGYSWENYILLCRFISYALRYCMCFNSCSYLGITTYYCKPFTLALHPDCCAIVDKVIEDF